MFEPNRIAEVLSILLSEQYGTPVKVTLEKKEGEKE